MKKLRISIPMLKPSYSTLILEQSMLTIQVAFKNLMCLQLLRMKDLRKTIMLNVRLNRQKTLLSSINIFLNIAKGAFIPTTKKNSKQFEILH